MNRNGFTLVEMIAAVAILAILTLIAIPSITRMRGDVLEQTYSSRIDLIKYAALNWSNDHLEDVKVNVDETNPNSSCIFVTVATLIEQQYLTGTNKEKTIMEDPRDNTSLNSKNVCVRYNSNDVRRRKLIAYIVN